MLWFGSDPSPFSACLIKIRQPSLLLIAALAMPAALATTTGATLPPSEAPAPAPASAPAPAPRAHSAAVEQGPPGLRRCVTSDGSVLVTDHGCSAQGASDFVPPKDAPPPSAVQIVRVRTCARNQGDLVNGVRDALESRDPNRLAEFYHWSGMSTAQGYQLLDRLATFSARPLVDVQLANSAELRSPGPNWPERQPARFEDLHSDAGFDPDTHDPDQAPAPSAKPADLLRVDQLRSDKALDSQVSYLHLLRNAGCWWLQF